MAGRRLERGERLVVASHNKGKLVEIAELVKPYGLDAVSAGTLGLAEPEETGMTFIANAELKALAAATASGLPALADDSGMTVAALGGQPGIYSARWAGPKKDFTFAMQKVEDALAEKRAAGILDRRAEFVCALTLAWPDGECVSVEGRVPGTLVWPARGKQGFGYDPMFLPEGSPLTFGEMEAQAKHAISHRARAFTQLVAAVFPE